MDPNESGSDRIRIHITGQNDRIYCARTADNAAELCKILRLTKAYNVEAERQIILQLVALLKYHNYPVQCPVRLQRAVVHLPVPARQPRPGQDGGGRQGARGGARLQELLQGQRGGGVFLGWLLFMGLLLFLIVIISVVDPHHIDADPDLVPRIRIREN